MLWGNLVLKWRVFFVLLLKLKRKKVFLSYSIVVEIYGGVFNLLFVIEVVFLINYEELVKYIVRE